VSAHLEFTTEIAAPAIRVFDLSLSVDAHAASMADFGERAVSGVTKGILGLNQEVTWQAKHFGHTWTMTSRIIELDRPRRFVDQQVRGPFARFHHEHRFEANATGTTMVDVVTFAPPLGLLGRCVQPALSRYVKGLITRRNAFLKAAAEEAPA
jgi:ligand-binding SRPBCC domain-containing protein